MKRGAGIFAAASVLAVSFSACGNAGAVDAAAEAGEKDTIQIVTTIFPEYDWVNAVLGEEAEHAEVRMLLDNGVDLHSYQPSAQDILAISTCDLFIYVGGESDVWVKDALAEASNQDMIVIDLMESLGEQVKEEELVEGMEEGHDHDHEHEGEEDHGHGEEHEGEEGHGHEEEHEGEEGHGHEEEHEGEEGHEHEAEHEGEEGHEHEDGEEPEYDEHVWLSLRNASVFCEDIADALAQIDTAHADAYHANAAEYAKKLAALDQRYQSSVDQAACRTLLFADRFPFRYLTDDYDLDYYAAFAGCSAETEASFETVLFLAGKVDELGLHTILTIESSDGKMAQTVKEATAAKDQQILILDSMQSITSADAAAGVSYLSVMEKNLAVLQQALQ